ncbi:linear amide C-N hydrolase [Brucella pseudogrignonensis]|uniref:linear amide C-N hydrolase n=1 Tax=Brucella pseudogrignonensis TaxID=419475 RepID=UPI000CFAAACA|nr:choloylglycine hydrolase family protein [Brucella pseudogrignonensis]MQP39169.1 linear amide C-N hydrolase [Ochrobactrum sp. MYb237]PQZ43758.1 choloylglycine hydrolase [Brucella pseudogrignonensis]PRA43505.1 choloylglycine hydrolase [Brucella pseudogrignonensis]PRA72026.1 choloylglycine hydrolase [Brucella pseudogrignonensis]
MQKNWSIWKSSYRMLARGAAVATLASALIVPQVAQACTSFVLPTTDGSVVYGRTMEFAFPIDSDLIVLPRNFEISATPADGKEAKSWKAKYAAVGMNAFGVTALADGMNEKGLTGGVLYFPDFAKYTDPADAKAEDSLAPWDVLTWALTNFATVAEVKEALSNISVVTVIQKNMGIAPPLHYTLHDATGASIVIEPVDGKLKVYDNPLGVMTNSPSFDWHMTNLRNYVKLSPNNAKPVKILGAEITPLGEGSGMLGIPGDTTPPSRFVRASAYVLSAKPVASGVESVRLAEHIVNNFDIPKGWIEEPNTPAEYTQWSTIGDLKNQVYYIKTYDDPVLRGVSFKDLDLDAKDMQTIKMHRKLEPASLIEKK